MNTRQENKLSMFIVVREYLNKNAAITTALPNFASLYTALTDGINQIHDIRALQELDKKGLAVTKRSLKGRLIESALDVSRKTVAYAEFAGNNELSAEVNYTKSDLLRCSDTILFDRAQIIYVRALAIAPLLVPYDVSASQLAGLQILLSAYSASIPKPRLGIAEKKQATDRLPVLIRQVDTILHQVDILLEVMRNTNYGFYSAYKSVRLIVDYGHGKMALKGKVRDSESTIALHGARMIFSKIDINGNPDPCFRALNKKSAKKGGFSIKKLPQGTYKVTINKPGYNDAIFTVYVTEGILCRFQAALQRVTY